MDELQLYLNYLRKVRDGEERKKKVYQNLKQDIHNTYFKHIINELYRHNK